MCLLELYSYTEETEFFVNKKCFDETSMAFCELNNSIVFVVFFSCFFVELLQLCCWYIPLFHANMLIFVAYSWLVVLKFIIVK